MNAVTDLERQRAIAWIVRQMTWERTLDELRSGADAGTTEERIAA